MGFGLHDIISCGGKGEESQRSTSSMFNGPESTSSDEQLVFEDTVWSSVQIESLLS